MEKAQEILKHIDELYCKRVDLLKIENMPEENHTQYQAWVDAFKEYDLSDVLQAIDNYWEFKSSKTKPNVAQIKAILSSHKVEKNIEQEKDNSKYISDFSITQMQKDIELGRNRHLLSVYKLAYSYITSELLLKEIPLNDWRKMSLYERHKQAEEKGLLNKFDDILVQICEKHYGKKYQYPSANMLKPIDNYSGDKMANYLSSQWRLS